MLTKKQFQTKYNLTKREIDGICEYYGINKDKGQFQIPDDTEPVYIPDKRFVNKELRLYLFVFRRNSEEGKAGTRIILLDGR